MTKENPKTPGKTKAGGQKPSRVGKVMMPFWISTEVRKQLRIIAAEEDNTQQGMMEEALDDLFKKYGKPSLEEQEGGKNK